MTRPTAVAQVTSSNRDAICTGMRANAIAISHVVPAGIVAVHHAKERRYPLQYIGPPANSHARK